MTRHLRTTSMVHSAARMQINGLRRTGAMAAAAAVAALAVTACGTAGRAGGPSGGSGSARSLLQGTLEGGHGIRSGVLSLQATLSPHGSTASGQSMTISFGGPFQQLGSGGLTASDFTFSLAAAGQRLSFGLRTTATAGFMQVQGTWYRLPAREFAQLRQSLGSAGGAAGSLPGLSVSPLQWLSDPQIVGTASVDGTPTTEVRARLDVGALASDLAKLLSKQSGNPALKRSGPPTTITPAQRRQLVTSLRHPSVDAFIGRDDHLLRRATLDVDVRVPAQRRSQLGGISSLGAKVTLNYSQLDQPQTITAPPSAKPYGELSRRLLGLGAELGNASSSSSSGAGATGAGGSAKYQACLQRSGGNVTKLQKCASLIDAAGR
jgi:hypothetical protein